MYRTLSCSTAARFFPWHNPTSPVGNHSADHIHMLRWPRCPPPSTAAAQKSMYRSKTHTPVAINDSCGSCSQAWPSSAASPGQDGQGHTPWPANVCLNRQRRCGYSACRMGHLSITSTSAPAWSTPPASSATMQHTTALDASGNELHCRLMHGVDHRDRHLRWQQPCVHCCCLVLSSPVHAARQ
jgi:hypothetical protein